MAKDELFVIETLANIREISFHESFRTRIFTYSASIMSAIAFLSVSL